MELPDRFYFTTRTNTKPIYMACLNGNGRYEVWLYPRNPNADHGTHLRSTVKGAIESGQWKIVDFNTNEGASFLLERNGQS